ncbi:MAG: 2-hydroxychromene-2-carboxylate isomerase [Myxococcaceae bacterium]|nr:2-hydroxychromene-2-carboxylate isomerase [Myxococcaceae bacterium]
MARELRFYFDFISPYAYLAWKKIPALAERNGCTLSPVPVLFAGLLNEHGQKGPAEIAPKRIYTFKHAVRLAYAAKLPLVPPPSHPFNPLLALRVSSLDLDPADRVRIIGAFFDATWGGHGGIAEKERVVATLDALGLDGPALVALAETQPIKDRVRAQTDAAIAAGVFGVPTTIVDDEPFWGYDALAHVEDYLNGKDPFQALKDDPEVLRRWIALPASAERRRS